MKPKKYPERTCVACRKKRLKRELLRIVRTPEGEIVLDRTGKMSGRGAYVCPDPECILSAQSRKRVSAALKVEVPASIFDELGEELRSESR